MKFEAIVLGAGDGFSQYQYPASLLLWFDDFYLAIDCPDRYRAVLNDAALSARRPLPLADINDFLITHVHGDHMGGLEMVAFYKMLVERHPRLNLHTTKEVRQVIWDQRLKGSMGWLKLGETFQKKRFEDYFDYCPLHWHRANRVGPFEIKIRPTIHHVPTSALLIEGGGRRLGYSADTAFDPGLIAFLEPADVIIHETNLGNCHTAIEQLNTLPQSLKSKIRLIHYPDEFDPLSAKMSLLKQGQVLAI